MSDWTIPYRTVSQQQGEPRKISYGCSCCRTGLVLLLSQFGLVKLAAEIAAACSNLPLARSSLHCCSLSHGLPLSLRAAACELCSFCWYSACSVSSLHLSHVRKEHSPCQVFPCSHLIHAERALQCFHFVQESNYLVGSGDAGVPNTAMFSLLGVCKDIHTPMKRVSLSICSALQMNFIIGKCHPSYTGSVLL